MIRLGATDRNVGFRANKPVLLLRRYFQIWQNFSHNFERRMAASAAETTIRDTSSTKHSEVNTKRVGR
jgi:hypothetical protein